MRRFFQQRHFGENYSYNYEDDDFDEECATGACLSIVNDKS